jgi:hypothetical protein
MSHQLHSPPDATRPLAELFEAASLEPLELIVQEDRCFQNNSWLSLGTVRLRPSTSEVGGENSTEAAVAYGFYELALQSASILEQELVKCLGISGNQTSNDKQRARAASALGMIPSLLSRLGFIHPRFDADLLEILPFKRPTTIVADTSAVHGGALDFVSRFLYPTARLKVPGIVHMEVVNEVDGYIRHRRAAMLKLKRGEALLSRIKGLGGQRVLLRLEMSSEMEVERSSIFADPLRNAFQPDKESEATDLNVTAAVRSYADRLVLETARQQQAHVTPGHQVYLMTSDQGLARMALAEGIRPMFFSTDSSQRLLPSTFSGVAFHPFVGSLYSVPLSSLLWEFANCFGTVRLGLPGGPAVEVAAVGANLPWQPFHSIDDLIWLRKTDFDAGPVEPTKNSPNVPSSSEAPSATRSGTASPKSGRERPVVGGDQTVRRDPEGGGAGYKFSAGGLISVISTLCDAGQADQNGLAYAVGVKPDQFRSYTGFLKAGGFVSIDGEVVVKTDLLDRLVEAIRSRDFRAAGVLLRRVSSFSAFVDDLTSQGHISDHAVRSTMFWRYPNYRRLGEACGFMLFIPRVGLCATPSEPTATEYVEAALRAYRGLLETAAQGDGYVLTGAWLEVLVREAGIHPLVARDQLQLAQASGDLKRFTRGATPDTRFEDHQFHTFEPHGAAASLAPVHLYHGDFLIPDRTSVELRLDAEARL